MSVASVLRSAALTGALAMALTACSSGATPAPDAEAAPSAPAARPIAGTAAESWAEGAAGFGEPPNEPPAGVEMMLLVAAQRYALKNLEAALLDPAVLYEQDLEPVYRAIGPGKRSFFEEEVATRLPPYAMGSTFAPGFTSDGPTKIQGTWSVGIDVENGIPLVLTWTGTAVYQVRDATGRVGAVPVDRMSQWYWNESANGSPGYVTRFRGSTGLDRCATLEQKLLVPSLDAEGLVDRLAAPANEETFSTEVTPPDCGATPAATPSGSAL